ncbi:AAA family ATPase [Vibrio splendidus]
MAIKKVVDWVNDPKRTLWWRHAIRLALENGVLSKENMETLYSLARMEVGAIDKSEEFVKFTNPVQTTGFEVEEAPVCLISIGDTQNVSTLVNDQTLTFSATGLTAVYGDNGSGKSSYAKILKNACLTRGDTPPIISDIYNPKPNAATASLTVQVGADDKTLIHWVNNSEPNEDLKSIRVFDSSSANHYISKEDIIEYKPAGLKLLTELTKACEFVKTKVSNDRKLINKPYILPICKDGTKAKEFLNQLSRTTTKKALDSICTSEEEVDSIENLQKELLILQTTSPEKLRERFKSQYKILEPLSKHFENLKEKVSDEAIKDIGRLHDNFQTKLQAAELARKQTLEGHPVDGICSPPWQAMWTHVEEFIKSNGQGNSFPPVEGEYCPTCLQSISEEAAKKLIVFNEYLKDKTQIEANEAKKLFEQRQKAIQALTFNIKPYKAVLDAIKAHNPSIEEKLKLLNSSLENRANKILLETPVFINDPIDYSPSDWIVKQIASLKTKEVEVKDDASLKLNITKDQTTILELQERSKISQCKQNILEEIERIKKNYSLDLVANTCSYGSVTALVTSISRDGSIGQLSQVFNRELVELGFKGFGVETGTRGSRGQQLLKLQLEGKRNKISEIASEGEQKCISLAGFLAELTADEKKSAVIFDDPINSLDHKWRRKFADRIAKESLVRQVIVLTHDLPFLKMLEESVGKSESTLEIVAIRKHGRLSGYPLNSAPWDALSTTKRVSKLKIALQELAALSKDPDPERYLDQAKLLYGKKRDTWERLVEEWLLKGVVERFGRDVKTQNIRYLANEITDNDVKVINEAMSKCSTFFQGHDRARELGIDFPMYAEVEADVLALDDFFKQLKKRR